MRQERMRQTDATAPETRIDVSVKSGFADFDTRVTGIKAKIAAVRESRDAAFGYDPKLRRRATMIQR